MSSAVRVEIKIDADKVAQAFKQAPLKLGKEMFTALQGSQIKVTEMAKRAITDLVYSQPYRTPGYTRTGHLRKMILPGAITKFTAIVGNEVPYAYYVHEGKGTSRSYGRRPYMELGAKASEKAIEEFFTKAVDNTLAEIESKSR